MHRPTTSFVVFVVCLCASAGTTVVQADSRLYPQGIAVSDDGYYTVSTMSQGGSYGNGTKVNLNPGLWVSRKNVSSGQWDDTQQLLSCDNGTNYYSYSYSAAFSHEATYLVVGTYYITTKREEGGNVKIFSRARNTWTLVQEIPNYAKGWTFGANVAISDDGNNIMVSMLALKVSFGEGGGFVYTFQKKGSTWVPLNTLNPNGKKNGFGSSIAIGQDGTYTYALVGAPNSETIPAHGVLYKYVLNGAQWDFDAILTPSRDIVSQFYAFGSAISISGNNEYIAVGAPDGAIENMCVFVYDRNWNLQTVIIDPSGDAYSDFGAAVSLSHDGQVLAVGSPNTELGRAYIFNRIGSKYQLIETLSLSETERFIEFGSNLQLSGDGNDLAVGVGTTYVSRFYGRTYFYHNTKGSWGVSNVFDGCGNC